MVFSNGAGWQRRALCSDCACTRETLALHRTFPSRYPSDEKGQLAFSLLATSDLKYQLSVKELLGVVAPESLKQQIA